MKNDLSNGKGLLYKDGNKYELEWKNDLVEGNGI